MPEELTRSAIDTLIAEFIDQNGQGNISGPVLQEVLLKFSSSSLNKKSDVFRFLTDLDTAKTYTSGQTFVYDGSIYRVKNGEEQSGAFDETKNDNLLQLLIDEAIDGVDSGVGSSNQLIPIAVDRTVSLDEDATLSINTNTGVSLSVDNDGVNVNGKLKGVTYEVPQNDTDYTPKRYVDESNEIKADQGLNNATANAVAVSGTSYNADGTHVSLPIAVWLTFDQTNTGGAVINIAGSSASLRTDNEEELVAGQIPVNKRVLAVLRVGFISYRLIGVGVSSGDGASLPINTSDVTGLDAIIKSEYFVSNNGDDSNDGLTRNTPLQTLNAVNLLLSSGDVINLDKGSRFREKLLLTVPNITIDSYGSGLLPYIDGADVETGFTENGPFLNVWEKSIFYDVDLGGRVRVFEDTKPLRPVADLSTCQITPGSYVRDNVGTTAGSRTIQFHPSDSQDPNTNSKMYEIAKRECIRTTSSARNCNVSNVKTGRQINSNGSIDLGFGDNFAQNCIAVHGEKHNFLINTGFCKNIIAFSEEIPASFGESTTFVAFDGTTNPYVEASFFDCQALLDNDFNSPNVVSFIGHRLPGTQYDKINLTGCKTNGGTSIAGDVSEWSLKNCEFYNTYGFNVELAQKLSIENSLIHQRPNRANSLANENIFRNVAIINFRNIRAGVSLDAERCIFTKDRYDVSDLVFTTVPFVSQKSYYNIYLETRDCIRVDDTNYEGDYNIFCGFFQARYDGVTYTSLSSWQAATGQDANSMLLATRDEIRDFFEGDPNRGVFKMSYRAEVKQSNGTTRPGQFQDNSYIHDAFGKFDFDGFSRTPESEDVIELFL